MENKPINISRFILGLLLISVIMDIPHLLFGFDLLSVFSIFFFLCIGVLFFSRQMRIYKFLVICYCGLVPIISLQYFSVGVELCPELWRVVLKSKIREAWEYSSEHRLLWIFLIFCCCLVTIFILAKTIQNRVPVRLAIKFFIVGILGISICGFINAERKYEGTMILGTKSLQPFLYPSTLFFEIKRAKEVSTFDSIWNAYKFGTEILDTSLAKQRRVVVLVIGETSRYDHWAINGYYRNTSPLLSKEANLYSFKNVASPASATIYSVPLIMTGGDAYQFQNHYRCKGIIDAFKEGGYYTVYLTNQEESVNSGYRADFHYQSVDTFLNTNIVFEERGLLDGQYDEKILPLLEKVLMQHNGNVFICIHTMGSHKAYSKRYPDRFAQFRDNPNDKNRNRFGYDKEIAAYDNSILYTDYVLSNIIGDLKRVQGYVSLIYSSDHGENLMDDEKNKHFMVYNLTDTYCIFHVSSG